MRDGTVFSKATTVARVRAGKGRDCPAGNPEDGTDHEAVEVWLVERMLNEEPQSSDALGRSEIATDGVIL